MKFKIEEFDESDITICSLTNEFLQIENALVELKSIIFDVLNNKGV